MERKLGQTIKQYREFQSLTQKELSDNSGVNYSTLIKLENGLIDDPSFTKIANISRSLKVSLDQLALGFLPNEKRFSLKSRRFLGNKYKLLEFIDEIIKNNIGDFNSFADVFAGTGVVGEFFNNGQRKIISNDLLKSNYVPLLSFLVPTSIDWKVLNQKINYLNQLVVHEKNYFSNNFGDSYFTNQNAMKIGKVREEIDNISEDKQEKSLLLTSLIYAVDKVANTVGHYDAYRKNLDTVKVLSLAIPDVKTQNNENNQVFNMDANKLISKIECDILYLDPPYNSRQYSDTYHLLENLVEWEKPEVFGIAKKMDRRALKSQYCLKTASEAFKDLIANARAKHILLSYNNTGNTKHGRSNARISDKEILEILKEKGKVLIFEKDFKGFTTGKSTNIGNIERIFYCNVI